MSRSGKTDLRWRKKKQQKGSSTSYEKEEGSLIQFTNPRAQLNSLYLQQFLEDSRLWVSFHPISDLRILHRRSNLVIVRNELDSLSLSLFACATFLGWRKLCPAQSNQGERKGICCISITLTRTLRFCFGFASTNKRKFIYAKCFAAFSFFFIRDLKIHHGSKKRIAYKLGFVFRLLAWHWKSVFGRFISTLRKKARERMCWDIIPLSTSSFILLHIYLISQSARISKVWNVCFFFFFIFFPLLRNSIFGKMATKSD